LKPVNFVDLIAGRLGGLPPTVLGTWIVMGLLLIFAALARRALNAAVDPMNPDDGMTLRGFGEVIAEWLDGFVANVSELHGSRRFVPFFGSIFLFILAANFFGMIPGMEPPTGDTNLTLALGAICFAFYLYQGFQSQGASYLKSFLGPMLIMAPLMLPIEVADNLFRPFSLGVRLFANMFADHQLLGLFTQLTYVVVPVAFYALGFLVCIVQALVFMILSITYVRIASAAQH
jgi:F-type H+-transporting ATPase subunit a